MLFVGPDLARRLEVNNALGLASYARTMAALKIRPAEFLEMGETSATYCGPDLSFLNRAGGLGSDPETKLDDLAQALDRVEKFYKELESSIRLDLSPTANPALLTLLGERGYRISNFYNQLVLALGQASRREDLEGPGSDPAPVSGIAVSPLKPGQENTWRATNSEGFGSREDPFDPSTTSYALGLTVTNSPGVTCYLASLEGEPAGSGAISIRNNLALFFSTSVKPAFRRKGVQSALIRARLDQARQAGCDYAMVMTLPGNNSQRNLQRHGFQVAYSRFTMIL